MDIRIDWNISLDRHRRANNNAAITIIDYDKNLRQEFSVINLRQISDPRLSINNNIINVRKNIKEDSIAYSWDLTEIVQFCPQPLPNHIIAQLSFFEENATIEFGGVSTFNLFYNTQGLRASILNVNVHLPDPGYLRFKSDSILKPFLKVFKKTEHIPHEIGIYEVKQHPGGEVENIHSIKNGRQPIITFSKPSRGSKFPCIGFSFKKSVKDYLKGFVSGIIGETVAISLYYKLFK
ncbi:MAG: hypothetical protein LAN71_17875 [Acidobacteriia bacterium]|nr:hypothetical protein [Terriglobia bacterium]